VRLRLFFFTFSTTTTHPTPQHTTTTPHTIKGVSLHSSQSLLQSREVSDRRAIFLPPSCRSGLRFLFRFSIPFSSKKKIRLSFPFPPLHKVPHPEDDPFSRLSPLTSSFQPNHYSARYSSFPLRSLLEERRLWPILLCSDAVLIWYLISTVLKFSKFPNK